MFYPEGLIPLSDVRSACNGLAWDRFHDPLTDNPFDRRIDPRIDLYSELLFSRFLEAHTHEIFVFQFPNIVLRASSMLLFQDRFYDGPCPETVEAAESALDHLRRGPRIFLTSGYRITADAPKETVELYGLEEGVEAARQLSGALVCWKPEQRFGDLEKVVRHFVDQVYWRDVPAYAKPFLSDSAQSGLQRTWEDFCKVCPNGKGASDLTWEEIQEKTGWSRRQIVRAEKMFGGKPGK